MGVTGKTGKTAKRKLRPTPAQRLRMLDEPALVAAWGRKQVEVVRQALLAERRALGGQKAEADGGTRGGDTCSRRWFDDVWYLGVVYPPGGGKNTRMRRCIQCLTLYPPQYCGSSGHCMDCRMEGLPPAEITRFPKSHTVIDLMALRRSRRRGAEHPE